MLDDLFAAGGPDVDDGAVIGIDLGTTNSVVAAVIDGAVEIITDDADHRLHPSVVAFKPSGERIIGLGAKLRRIIDPSNTVHSAKRIIGQPFDSPRLQRVLAQLPYKVEAGDNQEPVVVTRGGRHSVQEISSMVVDHLRALAEQRLGRQVTHCVITVPANFSDAQRTATRRAAERAGLEVLRVLNEPTAAALAYGQRRELHQRLVVVDLGGGTFDVTLLAVREGIYEVIATGGDPFLGGDDMDEVLAEHLAVLFLQQHRLDLRSDPEASAKLMVVAEQIKMRLSAQREIEDRISEIAFGPGGKPLALEFCVTRARLEEMISPIVERALACVDMVLGDAQVTPDRVDEVLLVGGASRVPLIRERVAAHFGREPHADINPMEVVAMGAALHAQALFAPDAPGVATAAPVLMDVTSHALGLATAGGYSEVLIPKNTSIPAERTRVFATAHDGQTAVDIRVCQGHERRFDANTLLGAVRLEGLDALPRGQARIEVSFLVDADGILQVSARDPGTGRAARARLSLVGIDGDRAG